MAQPKSRREQLGHELEHLRKLAGLSGRALATKVRSISQSTVSRAEAGKALLSRPEVESWAEVTGADSHARARLLDLLDAAINEESSWRNKLGDRTHLQDEIRARETAAHTVRNFQPTVVPGLLQTPEYAHYVIPRADVGHVIDHAASAAARLQRQQALFDGDRRFEFLIGAAALHWPASRPELLMAQLDRIVTLATLRAVSIAVLPLGEPLDATPWHNFVIYESDEPYVAVEMVHRPETITDPTEVDLYRRFYRRIWERAAIGADAVALIHSIGAALRTT